MLHKIISSISSSLSSSSCCFPNYCHQFLPLHFHCCQLCNFCFIHQWLLRQLKSHHIFKKCFFEFQSDVTRHHMHIKISVHLHCLKNEQQLQNLKIFMINAHQEIFWNMYVIIILWRNCGMCGYRKKRKKMWKWVGIYKYIFIYINIL